MESWSRGWLRLCWELFSEGIFCIKVNFYSSPLNPKLNGGQSCILNGLGAFCRHLSRSLLL